MKKILALIAFVAVSTLNAGCPGGVCSRKQASPVAVKKQQAKKSTVKNYVRWLKGQIVLVKR